MSKRQEKLQFERNQNVLKALLKEPGNKYCSDCKRNAYPRWASWNLGVFICIRCSGIHRSMGTHISRVKSVDLDSWTDEQLKNMVHWGNVKANKYWEATLSKGHQPVDTKMENFIRTKYELKRWARPGPVPDPDSISDTEREEIEPEPERAKTSSTTTKYSSYAHSPTAISSDSYRKNEKPALIGSVTARPASTPVGTAAAHSHHRHDKKPLPDTTAVKGSSTIRLKSEPVGSIRPVAKASDDLLSLGDDFSTSISAPVTRTSSAAGLIPSAPSQTANMRPDLKSSILSLYSQSRPQPVMPSGFISGFEQSQAVPTVSRTAPVPASPAQTTPSSASDLVNPFNDLSVSSSTSSSTPAAGSKADPFAGLMSANAWSSATASSTTSLATKPVVTMDDDLYAEFGAFASSPAPSSSSSSLVNPPASANNTLIIDSFDSPSFSNPITLVNQNDQMGRLPEPGLRKTEEELFNNVWD
ncbi:uncharacterized protein V1516DRAFT_682514 [Lipomyces oligophaga]|uniref:uncharacterized protein n=1 Tax=Lipomyces oligophaga TaxID=45792 RepID=UPI0034CD4C64